MTIPPTDAKTDYAPRGLHLERLHRKAAERREQGRFAPGLKSYVGATAYPSSVQMYVRPRDPATAVYDLAGNPYPPEGMYVASDDVYAHRRLRDGSLVIAEPP